ncbi:MAG: hypothetical protein V5A25_10710 [Halovenus sp.]
MDTLLADREGADAREESVEVEHWHERADGSVFWGTLAISPLWNGQFQGYPLGRDFVARHGTISGSAGRDACIL